MNLGVISTFLILGAVTPSETSYTPSEETAQTETTIKYEIRQIEHMLKKRKKGVQIWWGGWVGCNIGFGIVFGTQTALETEKTAIVEGAFTTFSSVLDLVLLSVDRPTLLTATDTIDGLPEFTLSEQKRKRDTALRLFRDSARESREVSAWYNHLIGVAFGAAGMLLLRYAFDVPIEDALLFFVETVAFTELEIWTYPRRIEKDWNAYRHRRPRALEADDKAAWSIRPGLGGFYASFRF